MLAMGLSPPVSARRHLHICAYEIRRPSKGRSSKSSCLRRSASSLSLFSSLDLFWEAMSL